MIDANTLKAQEQLASLSDEQVAAVVELAQRAGENALQRQALTVAGAFAEAAGLKFEGGDAVTFIKTNAQGLAAKTSELSKALEEAKAGADAHLKAKLEEATAQLKATQEQYANETQKYAQERQNFEGKLKQTQIGYALKAAASGLKFAGTYPDNARAMLLSTTEQQLLSEYDVQVSDTGGLVFKKDGAPLLNPANGLKPYTAQELLAERLAFALDNGGNGGTGAGTKPGKPGGNGGIFSLTASNRVQADAEIKKHLHAQGLVYGTPAYQEKFLAMRAELKVAELPLK